MMQIYESLNKLSENAILREKRIIIWGISKYTKHIINWMRENKFSIECIIDNFKHTFLKEYEGRSVNEAKYLIDHNENIVVLLAVNFSDSIKKQLYSIGIKEVYNLLNLNEKESEACNIPFHFTDRKTDSKVLCYIIAGYEAKLWNNVLKRIYLFGLEGVDYCIVSSGSYSKELENIAQEYGWSYLNTSENQVCYIQNKVIDLHPEADYIFKIDEDIFISRSFFDEMLESYRELERAGEYRIGFLVPVIPVNCFGYRSFLNFLGKVEEYEEKFGRAYRSRFSAVFSLDEVAEYLWGLTEQFDKMAERFLNGKKRYEVCNCYFNIGVMLYTRERWLMMGKWPEIPGQSGMGDDERFILQDNVDKDMAIYEVKNVFAGHFAFGHQKETMRMFYDKHPEIFRIS